ncbi:hypothetical protein DH2020_026633 [Rehmannia glutinosa]|uniref:cytokinin dehydrogenase n=1 Tax=Rehmannia glutinosa TaxID=99300 RepID=A0ABR0VWD0_REHGL
MANPCPISSQFVCFIIITYFMFIFGELIRPLPRSLPNDILSLHIATRLRTDPNSIKTASSDYGNLVQENPIAVLYPSSIDDIVTLIKFANNCSTPFSISARGHGHSVRGQAMARDGVVVDMSTLSENGIGIRVSSNWNPSLGYYYADVGGEQLWIQVLRAALEHGLAPVSWTDYLYLTVGGTLSNAGISGQSFLHGPQISNVLELDVITGKGDFVTCSPNRNPELFFGVLGGLGQFGIITRARIILEKAPTTRAKWVRLIYSDFSAFTRDQEHLISSNAPNYVEGILITNENTTNEWRSSFSSPSRQSDIVSLLKKQGILYAIELVKYYDNQSANTIDKEFQKLLKELNFIPEIIFSTDVTLFDFLNRLGNLEDQKRPLESHPWLHLFVPKSRVSDFNDVALTTILPKLNETSGVFLFFPFNRKKWDNRMSAVIPEDEEDIFYMLALLHSCPPNQYHILDELNNEIVRLCEKAGIKTKQYLASYESQQEWINNYGSKWKTIRERKEKFDPKRILSPGQRIFNSF